MSEYTYGIIDFELINRRNASMIKHDELTLHELLKINIASIFKLIREYDFIIPVLLWDKKPYFKSKFIEEYKTNRKVVTIDDLDKLDKDSEDYQKKYDLITKELHKNKIISESKDYIIKNWSHFTISIIYNGLEADDISYYLTQITDKKSIHISKDSDWEFHCTNHSHDVLIIKKSGNVLHKYYPILDHKVPLYYQKSLHELFKLSHNGIKTKKLGLTTDQIYDLYLKNELDDDLKLRIDGLNPLTYFNDDIKLFIFNKLNDISLKPNIDYIKSYNFVKHHEIYKLYDKQVINYNDIDEFFN